jgi:hypothetical protein
MSKNGRLTHHRRRFSKVAVSDEAIFVSAGILKQFSYTRLKPASKNRGFRHC